MQWTLFLVVAASVGARTILRFSCSQLVVERLDPLVNPGMIPSPHLHQIVGGNGFNATMDPNRADLADVVTCTSCTPAEDFSNYWTAVLFFRARNGTYKRLHTKGNPLGYADATGGQTVYYLGPSASNSVSRATAFRPGFRMTIGNPAYNKASQLARYRQLMYTCLQAGTTRGADTFDFPTKFCKAGIMVTVRFPTCWDGKNLDSPDHQSHVAYPVNGTTESGAPCPASHPVVIPQVFYETLWDTAPFNDKELWPEDEKKQPFVWSFGDQTGYGNHGDYVFGWKGDALQRAMDADCNSDLYGNYLNCPTLKSQSIIKSNRCVKEVTAREELDGWLKSLPGGLTP
ncbi:hypothetical protein B0H63DRAFT_494454 [Podospora didyma]|uniref:DUF1996 domain-containing protein n=1 Tax=Podospora didyma TaxID=330526 RepID=A0AAE0NPT8_9PEZI|nr:hypothetical protein B0H63DRAFT_494454 [Podospora didyma]